MKVIFYGVKPYELDFLQHEITNYKSLEVIFTEAELDLQTVSLAASFEAVCIFVNTEITKKIAEKLSKLGVKLLLLRCAGYNNVDVKSCTDLGITVMRVPNYSPEAVAEMAMGLALAVNRKIHKAYIKVRENNFALNGLTGFNFYGKTAGIIGLGKIGLAMANICLGFGMKVIAYDKYCDKNFKNIESVTLNKLFKEADLISLHCPLTADTYHMIDYEVIKKFKKGVILVNTSRGGLIKTDDLIKGISEKIFFGVALDVYEEEDDFVFENFEDDIIKNLMIAKLLSFPNVIVTSHQGFLTFEALEAIAKTTLDNALSFSEGNPIEKNIISTSK